MAITFTDSVVHEEYDAMITLDEVGDTLTFWALTDTRIVDQENDEVLETDLRSEAHDTEQTAVVVESSGLAKIYRAAFTVTVLKDVEETIAFILREMRTAA